MKQLCAQYKQLSSIINSYTECSHVGSKRCHVDTKHLHMGIKHPHVGTKRPHVGTDLVLT